MSRILQKQLIFGLLLVWGLLGMTGRVCAQTRLAADNSVQAHNSAPDTFEVRKSVTFMLTETTEVFVRYDLGQSHGCCADHAFGDLRILVDGIEVVKDRVPFVNYGVQPISMFLEEFDYFFPAQVIRGFDRPISRLDATRLGPLLRNYRRVDRQELGSLGVLGAGFHTFELELGDAGWNSLFEIYSRQPERPSAPDATPFGPLTTVIKEYKLPATRHHDVLAVLDTELWASVHMPANLDNPPYPLLVFLHGRNNTCGVGENPRVDRANHYSVTGTCPSAYPVIVPNPPDL